MKLTQEQIDQATKQIESHLNDIGILNNFSLIAIEENENIRIFIYEIANPTFNTTIRVEYDFEKIQNQNETSVSFSWMDYKKITE